jgi:hypothetical protein
VRTQARVCCARCASSAAAQHIPVCVSGAGQGRCGVTRRATFCRNNAAVAKSLPPEAVTEQLMHALHRMAFVNSQVGLLSVCLSVCMPRRLASALRPLTDGCLGRGLSIHLSIHILKHATPSASPAITAMGPESAEAIGSPGHRNPRRHESVYLLTDGAMRRFLGAAPFSCTEKRLRKNV